MKHALERGTRQLVVAERASTMRNLYVCPVCKESVSLRNGVYREAHFAHAPNVGTPECALFVPSNGSQHTNQISHSDARPRLAMELRVQTYSHGREITWGLHLSVPTEMPVTGWYDVDLGVRQRRVQTSPTADPTLMLSAEVDVPAFHICARSPSLSSPATELDDYCAGLNRARANLFGRAGANFSKSIPRAMWITPGGDYLLIWHFSIRLQIPPELDPQPVSPLHDWFAVLLAVPDPTPDAVSRWLAEATGLSFRAPSPALTAVWPPLVQSEFGQPLAVPPRSALLLALMHVPEGQQNHPQRCFAKAVGYDRVIQIEPGNTPLLTLDLESSAEISFRWAAANSANSVNLNIRGDLNVGDIIFRSRLSVYFVLAGWDGNRHLADALGEDGILAYSDILCGKAILLGLAGIPNAGCALEAYIEHRWTATHRISSLPRPPTTASSNYAFDEKDLDVLSRFISSPKYRQRLNFGALGVLTLPFSVPKVATEKYDVETRLSQRLRDKLCAYLLQLPQQHSLAIDVKRLRDGELVSCFEKTKPAYPSLATYLSLRRELTAIATSD